MIIPAASFYHANDDDLSTNSFFFCFKFEKMQNMATLFFGYSWRPLEPQQRNLKIICHLCHSSSSSRSSLSGGRRLVLLSDILFLFFFVEFSLEIKGRVSRWSHKVALFNGQTISATRCHFIKQKRIKFIQNWHVQSGAVSFVSGRVRLQMTMLSDCWLLHPIKNPLIDDHPSTCSARNLRHRCPCLRLKLGRFHSFCRLRLVWISQSGQNGVAFHSFEMAAVVARPSAPRYPSAAWIDIYSTRTAPIDFGGSPPTE